MIGRERLILPSSSLSEKAILPAIIWNPRISFSRDSKPVLRAEGAHLIFVFNQRFLNAANMKSTHAIKKLVPPKGVIIPIRRRPVTARA